MSTTVGTEAERLYDAGMGKKKDNPWPARLRAIIDRFGLTREEAAKRIRVSRRAWTSWESGDQIPSPAHQLLIELLEQEKI